MISKTIRFCAVLFVLSGPFTMQAQPDDRTKNFPTYREKVTKLPKKKKLWIFIMAGQSNMAGRGVVEPQDTVSNARVLTLTKDYQWVYAKEPLNLFEPDYVGLDCGLSFGTELIKHIDESVSIAVIHCAVGGSSIQQWLGDSLHRDVKLLSNFNEKIAFAKKAGVIKGILWHQGESDAHDGLMQQYEANLMKLIKVFRSSAGNRRLPVFIGELSSFQNETMVTHWQVINTGIHTVADSDKNVFVIDTQDLNDKGDHLHFDSASQRVMGKRFAERVVRK